MKSLIVLSTALTLAAAGIVKFPVQRVRGSKATTSGTNVSESIVGDYYRSMYWINATIGTPPQSLSLQLDTGSSDLWVPSVISDGCEYDACNETGSYNVNKSSTAHLVQLGTFDISYGDGTEVTGDYITDVFSLDGSNFTLTNVTMADASYTSGTTYGLLGVGYRANEASAENEDPFTFPTVPELLKSQGHIERVSYSLYLDSVDDDTGSILFGGIDYGKIEGDLLAMPISTIFDGGNDTEFRVALTSISFNDSTGVVTTLTEPGFSYPALLDSGTTEAYLPVNVFNSLVQGMNAHEDDVYGYEYVPCSYRSSNATVVYHFGGTGDQGIDVAVRMADFIDTQAGDNSTYDDGTLACELNVMASPDGDVILGDGFLRSAYVVYDLENNLIALGQAMQGLKAAELQEDIKVIPAGTSLPGVTRTATVTATQSVATWGLGTPGKPAFNLGANATATSSSTVQQHSTSDGLRVVSWGSGMLAMVVGFVAVVL